MKLELGLTYSVLKSDNTIITFKFVGEIEHGQVFGLVNGELMPFSTIFANGYLFCWEIPNI